MLYTKCSSQYCSLSFTSVHDKTACSATPYAECRTPAIPFTYFYSISAMPCWLKIIMLWCLLVAHVLLAGCLFLVCSFFINVADYSIMSFNQSWCSWLTFSYCCPPSSYQVYCTKNGRHPLLRHTPAVSCIKNPIFLSDLLGKSCEQNHLCRAGMIKHLWGSHEEVYNEMISSTCQVYR